MKVDPLYIFVHIPKTAGLTFRYHVRKNYSENKYILLAHTLFGLKSYPPPDFNRHRKLVDIFISQLSETKKSEIKIIFGHYVPYGIHKHFERDCRYITFVRHPVKRVISDYNYKIMKYNEALKNGYEHDYIDKGLLVRGEVPDFKTWVENYYSTKKRHSSPKMVEFLDNLGYGETPEDIVSKFYFVGLTRTFSDDLLYLSNKLNFNKFFTNKNKSEKQYNLGEDIKTENTIKSKSKKDYDLYSLACVFHNKYVEENPNYSRIVSINKKKKLVTLPIFKLVLVIKTYFVELYNYLK